MYPEFWTDTFRRIVLGYNLIALAHIYHICRGMPVVSFVQRLAAARSDFMVPDGVWDSLLGVRDTDALEAWIDYWCDYFKGDYHFS